MQQRRADLVEKQRRAEQADQEHARTASKANHRLARNHRQRPSSAAPKSFGPEPPGLWMRITRRQSDVQRQIEVRHELQGRRADRAAAGMGEQIAHATDWQHAIRTTNARHAATDWLQPHTHTIRTTTTANRWGPVVERSLAYIAVGGHSIASSLSELSEGETMPRRWQDVVCALGEAEVEHEAAKLRAAEASAAVAHSAGVDVAEVQHLRHQLKALSIQHRDRDGFVVDGSDPAGLFRQLDKDGSGSLELQEFKGAVRKQGKIHAAVMSDVMLENVFRAMDLDGGGSIGAEELVQFLGPEAASGGTLSLHTSKIGDEGGRMLSAALDARFEKVAKRGDMFTPDERKGTLPFTSLILGDCELSVAGLAPLAAVIKKRGFAGGPWQGSGGGLQALHLGANPKLGDSGLLALAQMLPPVFIGPGDLSTLRVLYIEDTGCGDEGMQAVAAALLKMPKLQELHVADNPGIGPAGWEALGASLPSLLELRELRASRCRGMGCSGVSKLVAKLPFKGMPSLEELDLDDCDIGVEGARALTAVLKRCPELIRLNVRENPLGAAGQAALQAASSKGKPGSAWSWGEHHPRKTPLRLTCSEDAGRAGGEDEFERSIE